MSYNSDATWQKQPWEGEYSPAAVALTNVAADATTGRDIVGSDYPRKQQFNMTASVGNVIINVPSAGRDGQTFQYLITASGGARTVSFEAGIVGPALLNAGVIASGKTRFIEIQYNGTEWFCTADREEDQDASDLEAGEVTFAKMAVAPKSVITIPINLVSVADGDVVTGYVPGFKGKIIKASILCSAVTTDANGATTLNLEIGSTNLTGGVITVTNASMKTRGLVTDGTAITADNAFNATDAISVEAASTTAFDDGSACLLLVVEMTD